jgi:hypothetical protein
MAETNLILVADRFWSKVDKTSTPSGCWNWTAAFYTAGYGKFSVAYKQLDGAHRVAWRLTFGDIPEGLQVCHACDNPACCRPAHLFLGTAIANMVDAHRKGRISHAGVPAPNRKFSDEQIVEIRAANAAGDSHREIGRRFGVNHRTIGRVLKGDTYRAPAA